MADIQAYKEIMDFLKANNAQLVAVSKYKSDTEIMELYEAGQRDFGENYVQELNEKYESLPKDIRWHFIGHLQSNKVKYIAPYIHLIQSVDSFKLLKEINKEAQKSERVIDILLQIYVGEEATKYGLDEKESMELLQYYEAQRSDLKNVRIKGLMGMATLTEDIDIIKVEFDKMKDLFEILRIQFFMGEKSFDTLSMGMSSDYKYAVNAGSNMVRIGSSIFGERIQ